MCAVVVELDAQNIATAIACVKRTAESQNNNNFLTGLQQYCSSIAKKNYRCTLYRNKLLSWMKYR